MNRKQFSMIAAGCGALTFLGVLLPWASAGPISINGTEGEFKGLAVLFIGLIAGAGALLVFLGKTDILPLDGRQHLFASVGLFALAFILTLTDFLREFGGASRGFGLWLTLIATAAGAGLAFMATLKSGDSAAS